MTLAEKVTMLHGDIGDYVGNVPANTRLGIPALTLNDGPQGFRDEATRSSTTAFPSGQTVAATFDENMAWRWGDAMGREFAGKGSNIQLGPGLNVARVPVNGRNFEYMSGEDPFLGYTLVQPVVRAIQGHGVIANAKHYVLNNQETHRDSASSNADERTRFEIYYQPFMGAVEAGVGSFMCSYNKVNHIYSCENNETLNTDLRTRIGFKGWVMSDWGATHSLSIEQGLDQEMPGGGYFADALVEAVNNGSIPVAFVNQAVLRILTPMFQVGIFDFPNKGSLSANVTSDAHRKTARDIAAAAMVLAKNEKNVLPLSPSIKKIALIGTGAIAPIVASGGSGTVYPSHAVSPMEAIRAHLNIPSVASNCSNGQYLVGYDMWFGAYRSDDAPDVSACCAHCASLGECLYFTFDNSSKTCYLKTDIGGLIPNRPNLISGRCFGDLSACNGDTCVTYAETPADATTAAKNADVAIVFVQTSCSEGADRPNLSLDDSQNNLVKAAVAIQPNTIVVVLTPGAVLMPWSDSVAGILVPFMPGQEFGNALVDVLFGDVNPSGRLPVTMPNVENEMNFTVAQYPGTDGAENVTYSESLLVGYRWYHANNVAPRFPFGHGLSYTTFDYSDLRVVSRADAVQVSFDVTNTGSRFGYEVAQLYVTFPGAAGEPPRQLKGFRKVALEAGEVVGIVFDVRPKALSVWDANVHDWAAVSGEFEFAVGGSSAHIQLTQTIQL